MKNDLLINRDLIFVMKQTINILLLGTLILSGCCSSVNRRLDAALEFAGDNRPELEQVLEHYKDSGEKYDAARFLIENMSHCFSYEGWQLDSIMRIKAEVVTKGYMDEEARKRWAGFSYQGLRKVYDSRVITASYLIENIDRAFDVWKKKPWGRALSFEEFCEWILPYRIANEPLSNWRQTYYDRYAVKLDSLYQGRDAVVAIDSLRAVFLKERWAYNTDISTPHLEALYLLNNRVGGCRESCDFSVYVLRSLGFPVTIDMYHYSPENQHGHLWNVLLDTTGLSIPFWFQELRIERGGNDGRKKGKVYRMCYEPQKESLKGMYTHTEVPPVLRNPYLKDVTAAYFGKNEVEIEVDDKLLGDYVYLGVFTPNGWTPVDIAERRGRKATVRNIEPGVLFMPLASHEGKLFPAGFPFRMETMGVHYFRPQVQTESAELWRKYPLRDYVRRYMNGMLGSKIELSVTLDFNKSIWVHSIQHELQGNYNEVFPELDKKCRYARFSAAKDKRIELAELTFWNSRGRRIAPSIYKASPPVNGNIQVDVSKAFDEDHVSYYHSETDGADVIVDFGHLESIDKIVYVARSDDNFVSRGDTYELFYQNGVKGWVSLGSKLAEREVLHYDNIPVGALLWLRNRSRGREEQVFYIQDNKQLFMGE